MANCTKCGSPLKPGAKFCTKCGTPVAQKAPARPAEKGWFTDGVRRVANAVTGGALNREIQREQDVAVRQQSRQDQGAIQEAHRAQETAEQAQIRAEREAERARDRRSMEAVDGVDVVRGRAIWSIQPGEIARRIKETELEEIEKLKGIIVQEGCTAIIFANGELVSTLSAGAYLFYKTAEEEKAAIKAAVEKAENELAENERKALEAKRKADPTFRELGIVGEVGRGFRWLGRLIFGEKKGEKKEKVEKRKIDYARILARMTQAPVMRVYIVSDRIINMTFGGQVNEDGGIDYMPMTIPTRLVDVEIGVSMQLKVNDIHAFATNYLADRGTATTNQFHAFLMPSVQNILTTTLRNLDYQQEGLQEQVVNNLKMNIMQTINAQLQGIECINVLQITDRSADFERFRAVERELYCSEKELGYLQRTGEFRNRLAQETNKQTIDQATNEEDLRYALQQINKDKLLHDDEMEQFTLMLNAQKRLREAKSKEEEYEALLDLKKCRLVKEDEMAALEDALAHNKIERDSVTEIMRIQHQHSVDDARLKAQWALDDQRQDHDWEREDLQRRRDWGIEDEQRERDWMHEEQEYNRQWGRTQQQDEYEWQKRIREDDFDWQKEERKREAEWQQQERQREADWQQREREAQLRREDEQMAYERHRQDKLDDMNLHERNLAHQQQMMDRMLQHKQEIAQTEHETERTRIQAEVNMTQEQIAAAHMKDIAGLDAAAQAEMAKMMGSGNTVKAEMAEQQKNEMKEMYEKMMAMQQQNQSGQQQQANMTQQQMMQMMQMMMQGMTQMGAAQASGIQQMNQQQIDFMQQRYEDQQQRANEYRGDAQRQQDRMDRTYQQSMDYTTRSHQTDSQSAAQALGVGQHQQQPYYQQQVQMPAPKPIQPQQPIQPVQQAQPVQPVESMPQANTKKCPKCGAEVEIDGMFCGSCGFNFNEAMS
ncbi:MAG: zinc-ribbon domain-containing protein [Muribaculaceae bacterium]|nr:zinc-ribbon domain-containing protein [Muribaculaceae bacterium]